MKVYLCAQGSVLGPLLFLCFINDLPTNVRCKIKLYAVDVLLYTTIKTVDDCHKLQADLYSLEQSAKKWNMLFNPAKCEFLRVSNKCNPILMHCYIVQGQEIKHSTSAQGRRQGVRMVRTNPHFRGRFFFKLKITPNLTAPVATCPLALLCTTLEGHITLRLNHHVINFTRDAWLKWRELWRRTVQWSVKTYYKAALLNLSGRVIHVSD